VFLPFEQRHFKLELPVKVIFNDPFVAAGHENEVFDSGLAGLVNDMLDKRPIDDRQHFLRHSLSGRQKPGAEAGYGEDGFADRVHAIKMCIGINGYSEEYAFSFKLLSKPASKGRLNRNNWNPTRHARRPKLIAHRNARCGKSSSRRQGKLTAGDSTHTGRASLRPERELFAS
jgi:hypothetical protein